MILVVLKNYFTNWYLNLNANKTTTLTFHVNNRETNKESWPNIGKVNIANEECPRYHSIKLNRTLNFRQHLKTTKNIISRLVGVVTQSLLRTSVLFLVYSVVTCLGCVVWNSSLVGDPTLTVSGFNLPCALWTILNGIRTEQG